MIIGGVVSGITSAVDSLVGTNISGTNTGPADVSLGRITPEDLGFDQSVLTQANTNREQKMADLLARRSGIDRRASQAYQDASNQQGLATGGIQKGMTLADRIGGMAGRDQGFYRGLEGQTTTLGGQMQGLGRETQGLQAGSAGLQRQFGGLGQDIGQYRSQLDSLQQEATSDPRQLRQALTAQRKEAIQRDAQGQKLAMERTLASRGVDPTSLKALTAIGGIDANVMQQNRLAQQGAGLDARQMQQQRLNQRANLIQAGMGAVGQQGSMLGQQANMLSQQQGMIGQRQGVLSARQNLLNNLRQGRAQEFGMDQSALGQAMGGQYAGASQFANMANANRQFGMANTQMGIGLDQAGVQDAIFDINRMDQKQLSAHQINAGLSGQEAMANAQAQGAHAQAQATKTSGAMQGGAMVAKAIMICIPEGTFIDVDDGYAVNIRDIQVGQNVIGYNGEKVKVMQKHEYLEDPTKERFLHITFEDGAEIDLCDMHRVCGVRSGDLKIGDTIGDREVIDIVKFADVHTSYDLLTEDPGYQINGVPINSMIEELAEKTVELKKVA